MKSKLTLSLPEKTILEAKKIAKDRHTTVSGLFADSLTLWKADRASQFKDEMVGPKAKGGMHDLLGVFSAKAPFDERSSRIREKHG
jgi:hypothetical protein